MKSKFTDLNQMCLDRIGFFLPVSDRLNLSSVNKWANNQFKEKVKDLLKMVVEGNQASAEAQIAADPNLLIYSGMTTDLSEQQYNGYTAFQLAVLRHDVYMWQMMLPYFDKLDNGANIRNAQFKAIFPNGIPSPSERKVFDFDPIIKAIRDKDIEDELIEELLYSRESIEKLLDEDNDSIPLGKALVKFRKEFKEYASSEAFYNPNHVIKALEKYGWGMVLESENRYYLYEITVIGYMQRFVPAFYAQYFGHEPEELKENQTTFERSFKISEESGSKTDASEEVYFPMNPEASKVLGKNVFISPNSNRYNYGGAPLWHETLWIKAFDEAINEQLVALANLCSGCDIHPSNAFEESYENIDDPCPDIIITIKEYCRMTGKEKCERGKEILDSILKSIINKNVPENEDETNSIAL